MFIKTQIHLVLLPLFLLLAGTAQGQGFEGRLVWEVQQQGMSTSMATWYVRGQQLAYESSFSTEHGHFTFTMVPSVYTGTLLLKTQGNDGVQHYNLPLSALESKLQVGAFELKSEPGEIVDGHETTKYLFSTATYRVEVLVANDIQVPLAVYAPYFKDDYAIQHLARANVTGFPLWHRTTGLDGTSMVEAKLLHLYPEKIDPGVFNAE